MNRQGNFVSIFTASAPLVILLVADLVIGDYKLFEILNQDIANPVLDIACVYVSPALFAVFYIVTLVALCLSVNEKSTAIGLLSAATGVLSYGVGSLIKSLVMRPRPDLLSAARVISEARVIGLWHTSTYSFPSTTTMLVFGLTLPIFFEKRRAGTILVALSYFMGFAVIYTGFHFPLDVAAGGLFSLAITFCTERLRKPFTKLILKIRPKAHGTTG